jgi:hypothetical protein
MRLTSTRRRRRWTRSVVLGLTLLLPTVVFLGHPVVRDTVEHVVETRARDASTRKTTRPVYDPVARLAPPPDRRDEPRLESPAEHVARAEARADAVRREASARDGAAPTPEPNATPVLARHRRDESFDGTGSSDRADSGSATRSPISVASTGHVGRVGDALPSWALARERPAFDGSPVATHPDPRGTPPGGTRILAAPTPWPSPPDPNVEPPLWVDPYAR